MLFSTITVTHTLSLLLSLDRSLLFDEVGKFQRLAWDEIGMGRNGAREGDVKHIFVEEFKWEIESLNFRSRSACH